MRKQTKEILLAKRVNTTRVLFYLNAILWLVISIFILVKMIQDDNRLSALLVGFFLLVNVLAMFFSGKMLDQKEKWTYIFALVVILLNIGLVATGIPDLSYVAVLVVDGVILLALISLKDIYFK